MAVLTAAPVRQSRRLSPPLVAAALAVVISVWAPVPGPLLLALLFGVVVANTRFATPAFLAEQAPVTKTLLRLGVVLLGLRLPLDQIAALGLRGAVIVLTTVATTYVLTRWIGRRLGLETGLVTLVAAGFSICGAAAIAAVSDVVKSRQRDVALAVAMVTVFGGIMIGLVPWLADLLGLSTVQGATWAGASIHEVAQVAAAASILGGNAVAFAMLIKLGRVATLAPVCWVAGRGQAESARGPALPWFVIGFALMSVIRTVVPFPDLALEAASLTTNLLLGAGMFGLGLGLCFRDLWPIPPRLLVLAAASTAVALGTSLALVVGLY